MKVFLRVAAVLVAWGNWYALATSGNPTEPVELGWSRGWSGVLQSLLFGAVAGLLPAEVVFRLMRSLLEGGFLARYTAMAVAVCFGAMLNGGIGMFVAGALSSRSNVYDIVPDVIEWILGGPVLGFMGTTLGGVIGLVEGLTLGPPLAAILGFFRKGTSTSEELRPFSALVNASRNAATSREDAMDEVLPEA
jgi:hypothetical protein